MLDLELNAEFQYIVDIYYIVQFVLLVPYKYTNPPRSKYFHSTLEFSMPFCLLHFIVGEKAKGIEFCKKSFGIQGCEEQPKIVILFIHPNFIIFFLSPLS